MRLSISFRCLAKRTLFCLHRTFSTPRQKDVLFKCVNHKGVIILNRQEKLNALTSQMCKIINDQVQEWSHDPSVTMVMIKSSPGRAFCAGGDVQALWHSIRSDFADVKAFIRGLHRMSHHIGSLPLPVITLIDGISIGGATALAPHGAFRVVTERASFSWPECAIGLIPDQGNGYLLTRKNKQLGMFLALTGSKIRGGDILKAGIATHFVDSDKKIDLERDLMSLSNTTHEEIADLLCGYQKKSKMSTRSGSLSESKIDLINRTFTGEKLEDILKNLAQDDSNWAGLTLKLLEKQAPLPLKVTHRYINQCATMHIKEAINTAFRLNMKLFHLPDAEKGLRAALDKDVNAEWTLRTEDVTDHHVDYIFEPLAAAEELKL